MPFFFTAALPGTGAVTVQAGKLPTALADPAVRKMTLAPRDFAASEFSLVLDGADLLTDEEESASG